MGATQSKKRRKDRKRKRKLQVGLGPGFDMPRSASVDVIRTFNISATSCPVCQQLRQRKSHDTLELSQRLHGHTCLAGLYNELRDKGDGYESCPSCSVSTCCLTNSNSALEVDRSTMSLNRNLSGATSRFTQSRSSEFAELLNAIKQNEIQENQRMVSERLEHQDQHTEDMHIDGVVPNVATKTETEVTSSTNLPSGSMGNISQTNKKILSLLEDEETKLARWERQKLMTQQLRALRKHIQQHEAGWGSEGDVVPLIIISGSHDTKDNNAPLENATHIDDREGSASTDDSVTPRRTLRSKFSKLSNYRYLDNHPVLSKLQNEQNNRLESMERRIREIRISAMQEAERRKFAEIFPAKENSSETEKMMQEAREMLEKIKEEKRKRHEEQQLGAQMGNPDSAFSNTQNKDSRTNDDSGDIIPVHIVSNLGNKSFLRGSHTIHQEAHSSKSNEVKLLNKNTKSHWLNETWPNINLGNPLTWILLPFLLFPLILRLLLSMIISTGASSSSNNLSSATRDCHNTCNNGNVDMRQKKL